MFVDLTSSLIFVIYASSPGLLHSIVSENANVSASQSAVGKCGTGPFRFPFFGFVYLFSCSMAKVVFQNA